MAMAARSKSRLLQNSHSITKIRLWKDADTYTTYVFVGDSLPSDVSKALQKSSHSKTDYDILQKAFGTDFRSILNMESSAKTVYVNKTINPDDNINWLKKKLFAYLRNDTRIQHPDHLYAWINISYAKTHEIVYNFLSSCFKREKRISVDYFRSCVRNFFGTSVSKVDAKYIDMQQAKQLLEGINRVRHPEPLFFKYVYDTFFEYVNYNPLTETNNLASNEDIDKLSLNTYDSLLLESFGLEYIEDDCINLITFQDVSRLVLNQSKSRAEKILAKFFPLATNKTSNSSVDTLVQFVDTIDEAEAKVKSYDVSESVKSGSYVNFLQVRVNDTNFNTRQDLSNLFEALATSKECPFIKFKAINNIHYKVFKESLVPLRNDITQKWTTNVVQSAKSVENTYVLLKIYYKQDAFCSLVIYDNLSFDLKFNFNIMMRESLEDIEGFVRVINVYVKKVAELYPKAYIPLIEHTFLRSAASESSAKVVKLMTVNSVRSDKYKMNYRNFEKIIRHILFPYFNVINNPNKNVLHLQYKKVENFQKLENIQSFITSNYALSKEEVIRKVMNEFMLSSQEAENEYEKWTAKNELEVFKMGEKTFLKPKSDNFVNIKLRLTSTIDMSFIVSGVKSKTVHDRIIRLMQVLLVMSTEKVSEKKEIAVEKIDNEMFGAKTAMLNSSLTSFEHMNSSVLRDIDMFDDFSDDLFDDDDDLKALELEFLKEPTGSKEVLENAANTSSSKKKSSKSKSTNANANADEDDDGAVMKSYFMDLLKTADKDLFDYKVPKDQKVSKRYSTICQWVDRRQPVVVDEQELKHIQSFNKNIKYVKTGSTQDLEQKNFYICPQVWCPKSKVALTYDDYKNKYNEGCPYPEVDETPILLESKSFWGVGEKGLSREHFPGFLDPYKHPRKFCLPCCFKMEAKEGSKNKHKENTCRNQWNTSQLDDEQETFGNEKYIKAEHFVPLENARYGLLPKSMNELLQNKACGNGLDGKGLMTDKTDCILRKGINQKSQSFINALISVLDNPSLSTSTAVLERIAASIDMVSFTSLEHGKIMKLFINRDFDIYNKENFQQFVDWFVSDKQRYYINAFNLHFIKRELEQLKGDFHFDRDKIMKSKEVIREFLIYNAYIHFHEYLLNPAVEKHYNVLIDYIATEHKWLNPNHYNVIVIEHDPSEGKIQMICPFSRNAKTLFDMTDPFVFLFKQNNYYEPLCHVKMIDGDMTSSTKFVYKNAPASIKKLINFYMENCSIKSQDKRDLITFLRSIGLDPFLYVIDYSYRVCGMISKGNALYIPFHEKSDIYELQGTRFIYLDEVIDIKSNATEAEVRDIYQKLYKFTNDAFYIVQIVKSSDTTRISGVLLGNKEFAPVNFSRKNDTAYIAQLYVDDLNIFIEHKDNDKREDIILAERSQKQLFDHFTNQVYNLLENDPLVAKEFKFIMDPQNPFPRGYKRQKLRKLLYTITSKVLKKGSIPESDLLKFSGKVVEDMLTKLYVNEQNVFMRQMFGMKKKFNKAANEILFDHRDVLAGRLQEKISMMENPYVSLMKRLDSYMKDYVTEFTEVDDMEFMRAYINGASLYEDIPYKFRKVLPKHKLLIYNQYNTNSLYDIFLRLSKTLKSTNAINIDINVVRSVILKNIIKDFQTGDLDTFYENPSYAFNAKVLKLKSKSTNSLYEIFDSLNYYPSFYELVLLSNIARINVILIGRKRKDNEEGIDIILNNSSKYILLSHAYNRFLYYDMFQLIVKDPSSPSPQFIFRKHEISPAFVKYLESKKITLQ